MLRTAEFVLALALSEAAPDNGLDARADAARSNFNQARLPSNRCYNRARERVCLLEDQAMFNFPSQTDQRN